jgi:uncharacterized membrane protein YkgB
MELITPPLQRGEDDTALQTQAAVYQKTTATLWRPSTSGWDEFVLAALHRWSVPALRVTLGFVFVWFGALKVFGVSPIIPMLRETYPFLPIPVFSFLLGVWEILIGGGLVSKRALRGTLGLLFLHLAGTFTALWLAPALFFHHGNPLVLTEDGEFVAKNLVLLTAGLVIAGYELTPVRRKESTEHEREELTGLAGNGSAMKTQRSVLRARTKPP